MRVAPRGRWAGAGIRSTHLIRASLFLFTLVVLRVVLWASGAAPEKQTIANVDLKRSKGEHRSLSIPVDVGLEALNFYVTAFPGTAHFSARLLDPTGKEVKLSTDSHQPGYYTLLPDAL